MKADGRFRIVLLVLLVPVLMTCAGEQASFPQ
jgi:hypothetical protein